MARLRRSTAVTSAVAIAVAGLTALPTTAAHAAEPEIIQVLGTNDFHGRINQNRQEGGAAVLSGAVKQLRDENPNTVFAAAGDLIGASTFESFVAHDKPTIDALNEAGLEVSAVGNHEFDQGYDDLVNRVMAPYDADTNPYGGAEWQYLGANVKLKADGADALTPSWTKDFSVNGGPDVQVGFVGAVTEHLDELVSPSGIADLEITDIAQAANEEADELRADGADVVVLLVHEGAATTDVSSATDPNSDFGEIVNGVDEDIDAIISGHTHLAYNHAIPVPEWEAEGRAVTERPVVSAGQYGYNLNQLQFHVDPDTGEITAVDQAILPLMTEESEDNWVANYPADPAVAQIVADANEEADELGSEVIGQVAGAFNRAKLGDGTENRGGESTLGNLVAEVHRAQTPESLGGAQIAFMNPGGLRADMTGSADGGYPADLTLKQAAVVQPFANTLVRMELTGAQIKTALEQQWQPAGASRPFLRLGISKGFTYTYDPDGEAGDRIVRMELNGEPIETDATYAVTVNSFLAAGGDNFGVFAEGTNPQDTGVTDLQAMTDYMGAQSEPVQPDYTQRSVGVSFPDDAPEEYAPGDTVRFDLSSLAFSSPDDTKDDEVEVTLEGESLGTFPVDNTVGQEPYDEIGTATVEVELPSGVQPGTAELVVTGATTGTTATVPIQVAEADKGAATLTVKVRPRHIKAGKVRPWVTVLVRSEDAKPTGSVEVRIDGHVESATLDKHGRARVRLRRFQRPGVHQGTVTYLGNDDLEPVSKPIRIRVHR